MKSRVIGGLLAIALLIALLPARFAVAAVFIVRHAEKQSEANEKEVPLSEAGRARARRLAEVLRDAKIAAIYSTDTVRTRATAEPLARAGRLTPQLYDANGPDAASLLAARIAKEHGGENVLVVGHSNTVGPLVAALGCADEVRVGPREYDGLWIVIPASSAGGAASASAPGPSAGGSTLLRLRL
ncbi:MAG: histidine phosphatase family protein [Acidobacteria bacterium]|nr:histidine phosphatase family protein [Acidobacteriota bacterium]MCA1609664.1 histidine phosphatase family protein [Acidobacteriota bacterium]